MKYHDYKGWYSHDIFSCFILVDYQTGLWEKYLVTGDWSQSTQTPMADLNSFLSPWEILLIAQGNKYLGILLGIIFILS